MNKVVALYNVYEEAEALEESLRSVQDHVDHIVVADGAYANFPHDKPWSRDGTLDIAREYADDVISRVGGRAWPCERVKRNRLLLEVPRGWWALKMDADEVLRRFDRSVIEHADVDVFAVKMIYHAKDGQAQFTHSLFRPGDDWHYRRRDALFKGGTSITNMPLEETSRVVVDHFQERRTDDRLDRRERYRNWVDETGGL